MSIKRKIDGVLAQRAAHGEINVELCLMPIENGVVDCPDIHQNRIKSWLKQQLQVAQKTNRVLECACCSQIPKDRKAVIQIGPDQKGTYLTGFICANCYDENHDELLPILIKTIEKHAGGKLEELPQNVIGLVHTRSRR